MKSLIIPLLSVWTLVKHVDTKTCNTQLIVLDSNSPTNVFLNKISNYTPTIFVMMGSNDNNTNGKILQKMLPLASSVNKNLMSSSQACVELELYTNSINTSTTIINLISNTRTFVKMRIQTESEELFRKFESMLGRKPNFDSSITIVQNETKRLTQNFVAKDMPDWVTLDMGWTTIPPSVMSVHGYVTGITPDIVRIMIRHLGLKINFIEIPRFEDNSKALVNRTTDFSLGTKTFNHVRYSQGIHFSWPLFESTMYILTGLPGPVDSFWTFMSPFSTGVWTALVISMLLILVYFILCNTLLACRISSFHISCIVFMELLHECMPVHYMSIRKKVWSSYSVLFIWIILATLLAHAYRSTLLARLVAEDHEKPIDTFQDLLDNDIDMMMPRGTLVDKLMAHSVNPEVREVHRRMKEKDGYFVGIPMPQWVEDLIIQRKVAMVNTAVYMPGYRHIFRMGKEFIPPFSYAGYYTIVKHPWMQEMDRTLAILMENGIVQEIMNRYAFKMERTEREFKRKQKVDKDQNKKLEMRQMLAFTIIFFALLVLSAFIFVLENIALINLFSFYMIEYF